MQNSDVGKDSSSDCGLLSTEQSLTRFDAPKPTSHNDTRIYVDRCHNCRRYGTPVFQIFSCVTITGRLVEIVRCYQTSHRGISFVVPVAIRIGIMSSQEPEGIPFSIAHDQENFKLVELPDELVELILNAPGKRQARLLSEIPSS